MNTTKRKITKSQLFVFKATQSSAIASAITYVKQGISLVTLGTRYWRDQYDLTLQLNQMAAELEYTSGNHTQVDCIHREIVTHARRFDDTLKSYAAHICSLAARGDDIGAIRVGLDVLRALGHPFPRRAIIFKTVKEY